MKRLLRWFSITNPAKVTLSMNLPVYQVDAFTSHVFGGNPAAVIPLEEWLDDELLQAIANENNLSETVPLT